MLYGMLSANKIAIGAADSVDELSAFYAEPVKGDVKSVVLTDVSEHQIGTYYHRFLITLRILEFADPDAAKAHADCEGITLLPAKALTLRQIELVSNATSMGLPIARQPNVRESLGLLSDDPWAAKKFVPETATLDDEALAHVADIRAAEADVTKTGSIDTDTLRDDPETRLKGLELLKERGDEFHRFDILNTTLADLEGLWNNEHRTYIKSAAGFGERDGLVWFAFTIEAVAKRFITRLRPSNLSISSIYLVNIHHQPVAQAVPLPPQKVPPRPWNDGAPALAAMAPDEFKQTRSLYRANEFYYARIMNGVSKAECRVAIAPASYFDDAVRLFEHPLAIDDLLPSYLQEVEPGVYATGNTDWATLDNELGKVRGYRKSMKFTVFTNSL